MNPLIQPWQLMFAILCGWVNERQQKTIEFQNTQIETLMQKLGKKRILLTDDQRRLLASHRSEGIDAAHDDRHA